MPDTILPAVTGQASRRSTLFDYWRNVLHIDIAAQAITITGRAGVLQRHSLSADLLHDTTALIEQLRLMLQSAGLTRRNVTITLADELLRMWMVTPPKNATSLADCEAAARLRFQALFGESGLDWQINADWDAKYPFLACAIARGMLEQIHALCAQHKLIVQQLAPHFVTIWNRYRNAIQPEAWFAILNNDNLTLAALDKGRLVALRTASVPYEASQKKSWLEQHLQREALLFNLTPPKKLQMHGAIPSEWQKNSAGQLECHPLDPVGESR